MKKVKKRIFEVDEKETIESCLARIDKQGYRPVARREQPVFQETIVEGKKQIEILKQQIIFEAMPKDEQ